MFAFFGESQLPLCEQIGASEVPDPYRQLLVHNNHMTVTLEQFHGCPVRVRPYLVHRQKDWYGRKLDLFADADGQMVMTGVALVNFGFCPDKVRDLIVAEQMPLGRILIENDILRRISASAFLRFSPHDDFVLRFGRRDGKPAYGRLATIFCEENPAVELLEIVPTVPGK